MLIRHKTKHRVAIRHLGLLRFGGKQVPHMLLHEKGAAEDTHDLVVVSLKFHLVFNDCNETVCDYCRIDLYSHSSFSIAPEGSDPKILLYPFEEQLDLPTIFVKGYTKKKRLRRFVNRHSLICFLS